MVVQVVRASIKPEARDRWLEVIRENAARTRSEEGCESYQVAEDLELPSTFVIIEEWASMDAMYRHLQSQFEWIMDALGDAFAEPAEASIHEVTTTRSLADVLEAAGIRR